MKNGFRVNPDVLFDGEAAPVAYDLPPWERGPRQLDQQQQQTLVSPPSTTNFSLPPFTPTYNWLIPYALSSTQIAVSVGDLLYDATSDVAYPAGQLATGGSEAADQAAFAAVFIGLAGDGVLLAETNALKRITVVNEGIATMACPSQTWEKGDLVGVFSDGVNLNSQMVDTAPTADRAIGVCIASSLGTAVTQVQFQFIARNYVSLASQAGTSGAITVTSVSGSATTLPLAGKAGSSSAGGSISVTGGAGNGSANAGGAAAIAGGAAGSGNAVGGAASLTGGVGAGSSAGGAASVIGGASAASSSGNGGAANLHGGALGASGTGAGGAISILGGAGASGGTAGAVNIDAGAANSGTGAAITIGTTNATSVSIAAASVATILGGPLTGSVGGSTAAAGSTYADATALPSGTAGVYPTTAANGTKGVIVSASDKVTGRVILIGNGVSNAVLNVYGPSGAVINGASANTGFASASGKGVIMVCLSGSGNTWLAW